jgi:uncharacterized protein
MLNNTHLEIIRTYLAAQPVLKAYLFGSQNNNRATADSDIDLLVELDYSQRIGLHFVQMQFDLQELLQKKVDLVSANALSSHLKPIIDQEKTLIYDKN